MNGKRKRAMVHLEGRETSVSNIRVRKEQRMVQDSPTMPSTANLQIRQTFGKHLALQSTAG